MTLILDLVRHGHAAPAGLGGDATRELSDRGRGEVVALARELTRREWLPRRAFTSPLARARETAALLLAHLTEGPTAEALDALCPDVDPGDTIAALAAEDLSGHVVLVSHLPLLGLLAERLTGESYPFDPGTLIRVECAGALEGGAGRVTLVLHPAVPS